MKTIDKKTNALTVPHFAALVFSSVHIPGDERSRTNPGHGYPAENKAIVEYLAFDTEGEMQRWVHDQETSAARYSRKDYQIIQVTPLAVAVKTTVAVGQPAIPSQP